MEREAAVDTRGRKTGMTVTDLRPRWQTEAKELGITPAGLARDIRVAGRTAEPVQHTTAADVLAMLAEQSSVWHRMDVLRTLTDTLRPHPDNRGIGGPNSSNAQRTRSWSTASTSTPPLIATPAGGCPMAGRSGSNPSPPITPAKPSSRRRNGSSPGPSTNNKPYRNHPSPSVEAGRLDLLQQHAARAVAGLDLLAIVVGPAGTGKTTMLTAAAQDLTRHRRNVYAVAPTAKAARTLGRETGMPRRHRHEARLRMDPTRPAARTRMATPHQHNTDRRRGGDAGHQRSRPVDAAG